MSCGALLWDLTHKFQIDPMKRLFLNFSTTACVVLFTMGALSMLESQNYMMAGVLLFFAFWLPAHDELNTLFKRRIGIGTDTDGDSKTGKGVGSEEKIR
jgi:hypothetical protein